MSKCQLFKCQKSQLHVHVYTLQYYPLFTPIQHLTASFILLYKTSLSVFNTSSTPHRLYLIPLPYLTVRSLPFQHCIVPSLPFYNTSSLTPNHYATPHRPLLIIFNTLMFSVQHITAFLNLLKHPTPSPFFTPFQHITVISLPLYKTSSPNPYLYTTPHRPFLTSIQHLTAHSLPLYSTSPPVPCLYTTPTACLEA